MGYEDGSNIRGLVFSFAGMFVRHGCGLMRLCWVEGVVRNACFRVLQDAFGGMSVRKS